LDRKIALKLLRSEISDATGDVKERESRLLREAQAMARLNHPNVVTVHDVGTFGQQVFVTMEFVHGKTLRQWLQEKRRSWRESLAVLIQAGHGLAAAHAEGIVHRDFKPDNILVDRKGRVCVTDFGLARSAFSSSESSAAAHVQAANVVGARVTR